MQQGLVGFRPGLRVRPMRALSADHPRLIAASNETALEELENTAFPV